MAEVLFFGHLGDLAGGRARTFSLPTGVGTIENLISVISADDAMLGENLRLKTTRFVLNKKIVNSDAMISDGDEIGFLPPFNGG